MTKIVQAMLLAVLGLVVLSAATPVLTRLFRAAVPLVVTVTVVAVVVRVVWAATRRW